MASAGWGDGDSASGTKDAAQPSVHSVCIRRRTATVGMRSSRRSASAPADTAAAAAASHGSDDSAPATDSRVTPRWDT